MIDLSEPLRIAFIGAGSVVKHFYIPTILELRSRWAHEIGPIEIVAAADINREYLARMRDELGVRNLYHDYHVMLEKHPELHAVIISTPNELHAAPTIAAVERGLHILLEKPMARTVAECEQMLSAAKASGN